jgi:hypothetical protein
MTGSGRTEPGGTSIDTLLWVIVGTTITLLGMALGALVLMNNQQIDERLGTAFVILTFVALVVSDAVLVWRLFNLRRRAQPKNILTQLQEPGTDEPGPMTTRALNEPLEPVSSISERTTRGLEAVPRKGERLSRDEG